MDLFNRYMYLFTCLILSIVWSISSAHAATDISYTATLEKSTKTLKLDNVVKNGLKHSSTSIKVTPNVVASSIRKRLATGAGGLILVAAAYYKMTYNADSKVFEKQAEQGQWQWRYLDIVSSTPSVIANAVLTAENKNSTTRTYSSPTTSISSSGTLNIRAKSTLISTGIIDENVLIGSIGGTPNTTPAPIEVYSIEQFSDALINDAFAIEGSEYFPTPEQVINAGDALLDLYGVSRNLAVQKLGELASDATDGIKSIYSALTATQPASQDVDIKAPAVPDAGVIGTLPDFCSWATPVCDALSKLSSLFQTYTSGCPTGDYICFEGENPIQTTDLIQPDGVGLDGARFNGSSAQCPADKQISLSYLGNKTFTFSYSPMCSFAIAVNPIVVLIGYLVAGYMFINSLRTM